MCAQTDSAKVAPALSSNPSRNPRRPATSSRNRIQVTAWVNRSKVATGRASPLLRRTAKPSASALMSTTAGCTRRSVSTSRGTYHRFARSSTHRGHAVDRTHATASVALVRFM